jgi:hypothetical protein
MATLSPTAAYTRLDTFISAWKKLRGTKAFAGLTPDQFETQKMAPCRAARATVTDLENQLKAALNRRDDLDQAALETMALIVNAVKGDPAEGENGDLYEAMGFVRKSERKSGLSRKKTATEKAAK